MTNKSSQNRALFFTGLAIALIIAAFISPFASQNPDGLDRVAQDLEFSKKSVEEPITKKLPPAQIFEEYSVKAIEEKRVSTAIAGVTGTLVVFVLTWGLGKLVVRSKK